jgi:hypothetical protein
MTLAAIDSIEEEPEDSFIWRDNVDVQKLLDIVVHILVNEYVQAFKKNPALFSTNGDLK